MTTKSIEISVDLDDIVDIYTVKDSAGNYLDFDYKFDNDGDICVTLTNGYVVSKEEYDALQTLNLIT